MSLEWQPYNVAIPSQYVLSICAGVGGFDLGLHIAFPATRTACYIEREIHAAEVLAARMEEGSLAPAPIYSDLLTFDGQPWRGVIYTIIAGLPCQPYSVAGKQRGHDDERAIWPAFIRVVGEVQPIVVFLENVPAFLRYFRPVGDELQRMGYVVEEPVLITASECGASHKRERFFAMAKYKGGRLSLGRKSSGSGGFADGGNENMADADRKSRDVHGRQFAGVQMPSGSSAIMADSTRHERPGSLGEAGTRRGIREDGDELDTPASPRYSAGESGTSAEIRNRTRRGKPDGRCDVVADTNKRDDNRRGNAGPGRRGEPSDDGGSLGDADQPGLQGRIEREHSADERTSGAAGDSELADTGCEHGELQQRRDGSEYQGSGAELAHPINRGSQEYWAEGTGPLRDGRDENLGPTPAESGGLFIEGMADANGGQSELDAPAGWPGPRETVSSRAHVEPRGSGAIKELPLFAPGPSDSRWPSILDRYPWLAPAISEEETESFFRYLDDELAVVVDYSRTDALRACGNGCVALQVAYALTVLARRSGITLTKNESTN